MSGETSGSVPDEVRAACARVADRARSVRVGKGAVEAYATGLPAAPRPGRRIRRRS